MTATANDAARYSTMATPSIVADNDALLALRVQLMEAGAGEVPATSLLDLPQLSAPDPAVQHDVAFAYALQAADLQGARDADIARRLGAAETGLRNSSCYEPANDSLLSTLAVAPTRCPICLELCAPSARFVLQGCEHAFCAACISKYVAVIAIEGKQFPVTCPSCPGHINSDDCLKMFAGTGEAYKAMERLIVEKQFCSRMRYCSNSTCSMLFDWTDDPKMRGLPNEYRVFCPLCYTETCVNCLAAWHEGQTCEQYRTLKKNANALASLVVANRWKACPRCKHLIERREGDCNFVRCRCACGFCYECGVEYRSLRSTANNTHGRAGCNCELFGNMPMHNNVGAIPADEQLAPEIPQPGVERRLGLAAPADHPAVEQQDIVEPVAIHNNDEDAFEGPGDIAEGRILEPVRPCERHDMANQHFVPPQNVVEQPVVQPRGFVEQPFGKPLNIIKQQTVDDDQVIDQVDAPHLYTVAKGGVGSSELVKQPALEHRLINKRHHVGPQDVVARLIVNPRRSIEQLFGGELSINERHGEKTRDIVTQLIEEPRSSIGQLFGGELSVNKRHHVEPQVVVMRLIADPRSSIEQLFGGGLSINKRYGEEKRDIVTQLIEEPRSFIEQLSVEQLSGEHQSVNKRRAEDPRDVVKQLIIESRNTVEQTAMGPQFTTEQRILEYPAAELLLDNEKLQFGDICNDLDGYKLGSNGFVNVSSWIRGVRGRRLPKTIALDLSDEVCPYKTCKQQFDNRASLEQHLVSVTQHEVWLCCGRPFANRHSHEMHFNDLHR